jgi:hypothetical protein
MKRIIAAILLSFPLVSLAEMMVLTNQDGGAIALIKDICPLEHDENKPLYMALATSEDRNVPGCWFFKDMTVHVYWLLPGEDPIGAVYPALDFEFVPSAEDNSTR